MKNFAAIDFKTATIVLEMMQRESHPLKANEFAELCCMERKVVDSAIRHLREDGAVISPKRGYWMPIDS